jgi:hypothetical protein
MSLAKLLLLFVLLAAGCSEVIDLRDTTSRADASSAASIDAAVQVDASPSPCFCAYTCRGAPDCAGIGDGVCDTIAQICVLDEKPACDQANPCNDPLACVAREGGLCSE